MALLIPPDRMRSRRGPGWTETVVAEPQGLDLPAPTVRRWALEPGAHGPEEAHGPGEAFLYVVSGGGVLRMGGEALPLERESVVWLEPGDRYRLEAGPEGLEVLLAQAPEG